jgi:hypothetical protein
LSSWWTPPGKRNTRYRSSSRYRTSSSHSGPPDSCGKGTKRLLDRLPVLRILLVTLSRIRILAFTFVQMRIRTRILILAYKHRLKNLKKWSKRLIFHTVHLDLAWLGFDAHPDPDPAYHFDADPDPDPDLTFQFDADPAPQPCAASSLCHFLPARIQF